VPLLVTDDALTIEQKSTACLPMRRLLNRKQCFFGTMLIGELQAVAHQAAKTH
jgi:hypothetical protein